ncbi:glycosyltransferase [Nostoc sp.]|uniref:glycosyltransferase n=1 Tax=Nostoc sp. TaxID=1180 RepID=UPI002FF4B65B
MSLLGIRRQGGGRKSALSTIVGLETVFLQVLAQHTAGSPMDETVKWTNLTRQEIAELLQSQGIEVSVTVVDQLLERHHYRRRKAQKRLSTGAHPQRLAEILFTLEDPVQIFGKLDDPNKRPLFSMARLDRIKNLTGLAECFGRSKELQEHCNLILVAGKLRVEESGDNEERDEIIKLYQIIDQYNLHGKIRWLGVRLTKTDSGEIYRVIADRQGIFVQPALFEAFGLTILEAMVSGLPTFATQFGGPMEIIQDKVNGFYINPTNLEETATKIVDFITKCEHNSNYWNEISQRGIDRVYSTYTWKNHTTKLLSLARIYGFWNFTSNENREDLLRYIEALFYLIYKPRAQQLLEQHKCR